MKSQNKIFNTEKAVIDLQNIVMSLKISIDKSPESNIKQYMLFEISKFIELKNVSDFYCLQNKLSRMLNIVIKCEPDMLIKYGFDAKTLMLLEWMSVMVDKIIEHINHKKIDSNIDNKPVVNKSFI